MCMNYNREWEMAKNNLVMNVVNLGFPEELGEEIARQLGSPKAMERMRAYLYNVKPKSVELVIDEMLAIMSDIERWKDKKLSEEANAAYNDVLNYGFSEEEE